MRTKKVFSSRSAIILVAVAVFALHTTALLAGAKNDDPSHSVGFANGSITSIELTRVMKYMMEEEYPELFKGKAYRVQIEDAWITDLDEHGVRAVVCLFKPHYAQSPPIVIYKVNKENQVTRVVEGLAPGPLVKRGEYYLDSHSLGVAIDALSPTPVTVEPALIRGLLEKNFRIVKFRKFIHADLPTAKAASYIDMSTQETFSDEDKCGKFEFSPVQSICVGRLSQDKKKLYIVALVNGEFYVHAIKNITEKGMLEKESWKIRPPVDFKKFSFQENGILSYETTEGNKKALSFDTLLSR